MASTNEAPSGITFNENDETPIHLPEHNPVAIGWEKDKWWLLRNVYKLIAVTYIYALGFTLLFAGMSDDDVFAGVCFVVCATFLSFQFKLTGRYRLNKEIAFREMTKTIYSKGFPEHLKKHD